MTLGELIDALERLAAASPDHDQAVRIQPIKGRYTTIEGGPPGRFHSYRGYYEQLAIEPGDGYIEENIPDHARERGYRVNGTVTMLLEAAKAADGATFEGYKGGEYTMTRATPVWIAQEGSSGSIALTGIEQRPDQVLLIGTDIGDYA